MSARDRPASCWSTTTRLTNFSNQTAPLITTRHKLCRQMASNHKSWSQRMKQSKYNTEELFKLYYSNDLKFDSFQKQIVTGTRIASTHTPPVAQDNLMNPSVNTFDSKHCVTREQLSTPNLTKNEQQSVDNALKTKQQTETRRLNEDGTARPSSNRHLSPSITIPTAPNLPEISSIVEHNELCDPPLVKSVAFLDDHISGYRESTETPNPRPNSSKSYQSSSTMPTTMGPHPSLMAGINYDKSHDSPVSRIAPSQQQNRPAIPTASPLSARQQSSTKPSWRTQRPKSNTTSSSQQSISRARPPSSYSSVSVESDASPMPTHIGSHRVVSIPSRCSRYVLVTFPEVPLRYNAPTYVERLLLPERFPTLFQNILHSADFRLTGGAHHRKTK